MWFQKRGILAETYWLIPVVLLMILIDIQHQTSQVTSTNWWKKRICQQNTLFLAPNFCWRQTTVNPRIPGLFPWSDWGASNFDKLRDWTSPHWTMMSEIIDLHSKWDICKHGISASCSVITGQKMNGPVTCLHVLHLKVRWRADAENVQTTAKLSETCFPKRQTIHLRVTRMVCFTVPPTSSRNDHGTKAHGQFLETAEKTFFTAEKCLVVSQFSLFCPVRNGNGMETRPRNSEISRLFPLNAEADHRFKVRGQRDPRTVLETRKLRGRKFKWPIGYRISRMINLSCSDLCMMKNQ